MATARKYIRPVSRSDSASMAVRGSPPNLNSSHYEGNILQSLCPVTGEKHGGDLVYQGGQIAKSASLHEVTPLAPWSISTPAPP